MTLSAASHGRSQSPQRRVAVALAVAFALAVPAAQALTGWGQTAAEFAADGDETLRAAGYAFSIWGLISLWLAAYAVWQALAAGRGSRAAAAAGWPSVIAVAGCGLWLIASGEDWTWATLGIIAVSAAAAIAAILRGAAASGGGRGERWFVLWPLALLAGWLTVATLVNLATVLTARGLVTPEESGRVLALAGVAAVAGLAILVARRTRLALYPAAIAWGLAAVAVAERDTPPLLAGAVLGAVLAAGAAASVLPADLRSAR